MFPGSCCVARVELGRLGSTVTDAANRRGPQGTMQPQVAQVWDAGGTPEGPMARPGCVRRCAQGCPRPKDQRAQRPKSQLRPLGAAASRGLGCVPRRGAERGHRPGCGLASEGAAARTCGDATAESTESFYSSEKLPKKHCLGFCLFESQATVSSAVCKLHCNEALKNDPNNNSGLRGTPT